MGMACSLSVLVWLLKRHCKKISQIVPSFFSYTLIRTFEARLHVLTCLGSKVHPSKDVPTGLSPARLGRRGWTRQGGGWSGQEVVGSGRRPACVISKRKANGSESQESFEYFSYRSNVFSVHFRNAFLLWISVNTVASIGEELGILSVLKGQNFLSYV